MGKDVPEKTEDVEVKPATTEQKEATIAKIETAKLKDRSAGIVIRKEADLAEATEMLAQIKLVGKNIKKKKDPMVDRLKDAINDIKELFKPAEDQLAEAEKAIKATILKYHDRVEAKAAEKQKALEDKMDAGDVSFEEGMEVANKIKQPTSTVKSGYGTTSVGQGARKIRILDATKLPRSYFMRPRVLEALRLEVSADVLKDGAPLPDGAEIYREKTVTTRTV